MIVHILDKDRLSEDHQLCYIEDCAAYFTDNFENQWGDDWNDAPYESNAGRPYSNTQHQNSYRGDIRVLFYEFSGISLEPPTALRADTISDPTSGHWSVEDINQKKTPWLGSPAWSDQEHAIWAGVNMHEFTRQVLELGGQVYAPIIWIGGNTNDKRFKQPKGH